MKMRILFGLLVILMMPLFGQAQYIKRTGKILDQPDGQTLFTLRDSTFIWSEKLQPLWFSISKRVHFEVGSMTADSTLPAGAQLLDDELNPIGEVKTGVHVEEVLQVEGFRKDKYRSGIIRGVISSYELYINSRPEEAISEAFSGTRGGIGDKLADLKARYPFEEHNEGSYTALVLRNKDQNNREGEFPFRIIIVTRGSSNIVCVVSRNEYIEIEKAKSKEKTMSGYFTFYQRANERLMESIEDIVYHYLPL